MEDSRSLRAAFTATSFFLFSALLAVFADAPDLTSLMEPLCNPNASRWTASQPMARAATSLGVCDGKIFVSGGDWDDNLGPCPIFAVDPYTGDYEKEFESGTESIDYFRYGSDGSLYAPSVDPRENHVNECSVARRKPDGTWTKLNAPNRWIRYSSSENAAYGTHNWDFAVWKGKVFTAGYGLGVGPENTTSRLTDATPQINDANRIYVSQYGGTFQQSRRFYAFLPFEDDLFCYPLTYTGTASSSYNPIGRYDFEEWRYNESTGRFVCQTNAWANVVPGLSRSDMVFLSSSQYSVSIQLWHPTAFKGRVLYIAGIPEMTTYPFVLYSATNQDHSVRATRVNFGSGVVPFDVFVRGDVVSVLAAQYDSSTQKAINSVWESTDGVSFTKKFTFSGVQYANAIAYCDGAYYVTMGARQVVQNAWTFTGTDEVGKLYRIRDPAYADAIQVVAENAEVSVQEGGTAVARFRLAAQPAAPVTAQVRATGGVPQVTAAVASVTFTPQDWDQWHEVALSAGDDDIENVSSGSLVCGAGDPAALRAASVKVTPVNNDFRVPDIPPAGIVDITVPYGDFTSSSSVSINTNNPFNDDSSGTNIANRLLVQSKSVTITYDFGNPAMVNGYGIYNFLPSNYSPAERAPHTWTFQGSNNGSTWTTLDERHLESGWTGGEYRYYAVSNETTYTQYRLAITDNNGAEYTQFARLELYGTGTSLVGLTRASTGGIYTNSASHATYGVKGAFDGNRVDTNGRWLATKADHMYVVWKFNDATAVNTLRVWNGDQSRGCPSSAARSPRAWTFYGSNDGETWTALDARTGEPDWSANGEMRDYQFQNDEAYLYYKYDCTELCSASATYLQLWELEFYYIEDEGGGPEDPPEPVDVTDALEYLGNPAYSRWPNSPMSRHVQDLCPYKGKIYTSGGEWDTNTGPCPIFAVDPYSGAFTNEFTAGTDAIYEFKEFSDGRLYTSAIDLHEGAANVGSTFRRGLNDVWYAYLTACTACNITDFGSFAYEGYRIHNWDMAEWNGYVFVCGYGISGSTNWCTKAMFDTTPQLKSVNRYYDDPKTQGNPDQVGLRRFCTFLPFDDDIYCYPIQESQANNITRFDWEEWRFNESTRKFVCQTNTWANVAPGIKLEAASFTFPTNSRAEIQLWHPTKFGSRVLYIVGGHGDDGFNIPPWAAYSAVNENHHVKATKIDLGGDDVKPFDICVANGTAYIVAAQAGMKATQVTNSVWKSSDGVSFTKIFTFVSTRQASAICYYDGYFFLGMGSNSFTKNGWPKVTSGDISGRIYRVRLPQGSTPAVVASTNAVTIAEGGSGSVSFRLAAKPATNMTLRVWATDSRIAPSVASLSFTTSNWNVNQTVPFSALEDDESDANFKGAIVCGTGAADCLSASVVVTATNNDFRVVETAPDGLVDLTRPDGNFTTTVPEGVTLTYNKPFNDCDTNTNKEERLVAKAMEFSVAYDFGTPTNVNAYGILNFGGSGYSPVERAPRVWTFEGSNDGAAWTQLDIRRFEKNWAIGEYRYYSFTNTANYSKYRISFMGNNGNEYTQVGRLEFYHVGDWPSGGDEPGPTGGDGKGFAKKTTFTPSAAAVTKIGASAWANFPVLLRLPAAVSSQLRSVGGKDLLIEDENGDALSFEVETFNPSGTTLVWVKVPSLSSATVLTVYFGGTANAANDASAVWSRYAGVWHFSPSAAGTMTVPDATGNGLAGVTTNTLASYEGPAGLGALQAGSIVRAPDYDAKLANVAQFSASGWFKAPTQSNSWWSVVSKKVGITTGDNGQNLWNIDKGWYLELPQSKTALNLIYSTSAQMTVPDVTANWNYFHVVSDGSTLKVYLNGSASPAKSVNYTVKASGTPYQMCRAGGCNRELRVRNGAASAAETALEYATMADESFFTMGEIETIGVFVPAPIFGGEGVPAPAFGVDQSSGNPVFTFAIGNAVKGAKYRIYKTESLTTPFEPYGDVIEADANGILDFVVPTADEPSCFFKIVAE